MYGTLVKIVAKSGKKDELLEFLRWDAAVASHAEPGTLRFDVWDVPNEPNALYLYEGYVDDSAFDIHKANAPYDRYEKVIAPNLLDERGEMRLIEFTDSLISNTDVVWQRRAERLGEDLQPRKYGGAGIIRKLSFASFPPDVSVLAHFNDYAELRRLAPDRNASVAHVYFPPGVRTDWHRHDGEQLLYFIEGDGRVALRDSRSLECQAGDIVRIDAGSSHWHGASAEHSATHLAVTVGDTLWEERPSC
jgi:quercetin dioxygenase-like cupin family protein/quinol monooxygenase YgiN